MAWGVLEVPDWTETEKRKGNHGNPFSCINLAPALNIFSKDDDIAADTGEWVEESFQ